MKNKLTRYNTCCEMLSHYLYKRIRAIIPSSVPLSGRLTVLLQSGEQIVQRCWHQDDCCTGGLRTASIVTSQERHHPTPNHLPAQHPGLEPQSTSALQGRWPSHIPAFCVGPTWTAGLVPVIRHTHACSRKMMHRDWLKGLHINSIILQWILAIDYENMSAVMIWLMATYICSIGEQSLCSVKSMNSPDQPNNYLLVKKTLSHSQSVGHHLLLLTNQPINCLSNSQPFPEPEGSIQHSLEAAIWSYPEPDKPNPIIPI